MEKAVGENIPEAEVPKIATSLPPLVQRVRVERIAAIITWGVSLGLLAVVITGEAVAVLVPAVMAIVILSSGIFAAQFIFGFGGGFIERFPENNVPPHAKERFSVKIYGFEMLVAPGIVVIASLIGIAIKLLLVLVGLQKL